MKKLFLLLAVVSSTSLFATTKPFEEEAINDDAYFYCEYEEYSTVIDVQPGMIKGTVVVTSLIHGGCNVCYNFNQSGTSITKDCWGDRFAPLELVLSLKP